jgi:hypothetical protein
MKWLALFLTLSVAAPVRADIETDDQVDSAKAQLGAGIAAALVGVVLGVGGGAILATSNMDRTEVGGGALALGLTANVLNLVGIPLAIVGGYKLKELRKKVAVTATSVKVSF